MAAWRKLWIGVLVIGLLSVAAIPAGAEIFGWPEKLNSTPITSGAVLHEYVGQSSAGMTNFYVIEVDLDNPHVAIGVIPGAGKITQKLNVTNMALNSQAVAAVNGDFFNTRAEGSPIGPMVINGVLHASPSVLDGIYALGIDLDRNIHIEPFSFSGMVTAANGRSYILSGLNKTWYWEEPSLEHSHINKLHLYDDLWGGMTRGQDEYTVPTEVLIENGIVKAISPGAYFPSAVPAGCYILRGDGGAADFLLENCVIGEAINITYQMTPNIDWAQLIGGHALLVENGKAVAYSKDANVLQGQRSRTAAGMSQDGRTLYIAAAELKPWVSAGARLEDMADFMAKIGIWKAVNLDGGGSTTMVTRDLGDFQVSATFAPEQAGERAVVNALGVFTLAPSGNNAEFFIEGPSLLLLQEAAAYTLKGYDEYYNPVRPGMVTWQENAALGGFTGNTFMPQVPGYSSILAETGGKLIEFPIQVLGKSNLAALSLSGSSTVVLPGKTIQLQLMLTAQDGSQREVPPSLAEWQLYGIEGVVGPDGLLSITGGPTEASAFVVARYQGFSAPLALPVQRRELANELSSLDNLFFTVYPNQVLGGLSLQADPMDPNRQVTALRYDFTQGSGTLAAYMELGSSGISMDASTEGILLDVYGQSGNEWIRAEIVDGNGNVQRLDMTSVNWQGWKEVAVDIGWIAKPAQLKRIYVVTDGGTTQRSPAGTVLMKNLTWLKSSMGGSAAGITNEIILQVGAHEALVNDKPVSMDVPPRILDNRTMVPVRFLSEMMDATVLWDDATKRCTVIDGSHWIDLWLNEGSMVVDGQVVALDAPPVLVEGRTLLPLRAVAESLRLTVNWEESTQVIQLQKYS